MYFSLRDEDMYGNTLSTNRMQASSRALGMTATALCVGRLQATLTK